MHIIQGKFLLSIEHLANFEQAAVGLFSSLLGPRLDVFVATANQLSLLVLSACMF